MPNLFPTIPQDIPLFAPPTSTLVKFGKSISFDFARGEFGLSPTGKMMPLDDLNSWAEWCKKALHTSRYRYLAYSHNYGQELEALISKNLTREGNESEIRRMTTECLMVDPRTASVSDFIFEWDKEKCLFSCRITSVRKDSVIINGSVVIG